MKPHLLEKYIAPDGPAQEVLQAVTIQALHLLGLKGSDTHAGQIYPAMTGLGASCNPGLEGQSDGALNGSEQTERVRGLLVLKQAEGLSRQRAADFF